MAVEAQHHHHHQAVFIPSQLVPNRDFMKTTQGNADIYSTQMDSGGLIFSSTMPENLFPGMYQTSMINKQAESGLTYNNMSAPRKRPRDQLINDFNNFPVSQKTKLSGAGAGAGVSHFFDQDVSFQIQQQQSEIDRFIAQHTEKVRLELEEQRKKQSRMLISAIQDRIVKKLKEKDEEIQRMGKLNWVLQERVKNLFVENQIWRDLALSNEAAANSLRSNLEQVLAHVNEDHHHGGGGTADTALADDAQSSCGSNEFGVNLEVDGQCNVAAGGGDAAVGREGRGSCSSDKMCRRCGVRESKVLLLPCRHLCLCTMCGSTQLNCPVCSSPVNTSVLVNFS